jgi:hypothetical protein
MRSPDKANDSTFHTNAQTHGSVADAIKQDHIVTAGGQTSKPQWPAYIYKLPGSWPE